MPRILIHCPTDGRVVPTGQFMSDGAFQAASGRFSFRCPRCQAVHHWRREDAWMEDRSPQVELAAGVAVPS